MIKLLKLLTILILATFLESCVGIKSNKYVAVKPEDLKVSVTKKSKIFIEWGFGNINYNNISQTVLDKAILNQKKVFAEVIKESECCDIVNKKDEADIFVEGKFHNESSNLGVYAAVISGLTFTIIPCWTNSKMRVTATVKTRDMSKDYDIKDSILGVIWAPLVVATPFANMITIESEVHRNLYRTLLNQMKQDEFFIK